LYTCTVMLMMNSEMEANKTLLDRWAKAVFLRVVGKSGFVLFVFVCVIFEYVELPAKLLDWSLRNNKSNINQSCARERKQMIFCHSHMIQKL